MLGQALWDEHCQEQLTADLSYVNKSENSARVRTWSKRNSMNPVPSFLSPLHKGLAPSCSGPCCCCCCCGLLRPAGIPSMPCPASHISSVVLRTFSPSLLQPFAIQLSGEEHSLAFAASVSPLQFPNSSPLSLKFHRPFSGLGDLETPAHQQGL